MKKILYVDGERSIKALLFNLLVPLGGSLLISYFTMGSAKESYKNIIKPEFSPPDFIFGIVWPILYFRFNLFGLAFIELIILIIFIVLTTISFFKIDKISGLCMVPYLLWSIFASVLNYFIWIFNEA